MGARAGVAFRGCLVVPLALLVACGGGSEPGAVESAPPAASATPQPEKPTPKPSANRCAEYPPPFEASYLPDGFKPKLRKGAGLFKGAEDLYPSEGLVGHYRGPRKTIHANFQTRPGPLPYEPAEPRALIVLGRRGAIGSVEGGWSVEFVLDGCDFRMDTYGVSRSETVKIAQGLRETG